MIIIISIIIIIIIIVITCIIIIIIIIIIGSYRPSYQLQKLLAAFEFSGNSLE